MTTTATPAEAEERRGHAPAAEVRTTAPRWYSPGTLLRTYGPLLAIGVLALDLSDLVERNGGLFPPQAVAPSSDQPILPPAVETTEPAETGEAEDEGRPMQVLVVDDHDINRRAIQLILQPLGCDIATAADGLSALKICETSSFDLIFMDVRMPELDGRETTRRIRAGGGPNARVPVIAVTADTAPEDIAACTDAGMTYFVPKPITPQMLLGAINHVMSLPQDEASGIETAAA